MKVFRFYTVPVNERGHRELHWRWEDASTHTQADREFVDLNRCIEDARHHGFLADDEGGDAPDDARS